VYLPPKTKNNEDGYWEQGSRDRGDLNIVVEGTEPVDEVRGGLGGVDPIEEACSEIPVGGVATEVGVDGTEEVGGNGDDGLLEATASLRARNRARM